MPRTHDSSAVGLKRRETETPDDSIDAAEMTTAIDLQNQLDELETNIENLGQALNAQIAGI